MFRKGDFITVKPETLLDSGEMVNNWAGQIQEVYSKDKCCLIALDAQTMNSFDDSYLLTCIEEWAEPFAYTFDFNEIELAERRDTDEQFMEAMDRLVALMKKLEEEYEKEDEDRMNKWIEEFEDSKFFESLNEYQKENAGFILNTFVDYMLNYQGVYPDEWSPSDVSDVCLGIVPRKISAEMETFENYGEVVIQFFKFLGDKNYISNSSALIQEAEMIKDQIPVEASDPNNWGMAKSFMMPALEQGFEINDEEDLEKFMMLQQSGYINEPAGNNRTKIIPLRKDPFKGMGRNQKITIKYNDGRILENIKFKKVESALRNGECEIIKK